MACVVSLLCGLFLFSVSWAGNASDILTPEKIEEFKVRVSELLSRQKEQILKTHLPHFLNADQSRDRRQSKFALRPINDAAGVDVLDTLREAICIPVDHPVSLEVVQHDGILYAMAALARDTKNPEKDDGNAVVFRFSGSPDKTQGVFEEIPFPNTEPHGAISLLPINIDNHLFILSLEDWDEELLPKKEFSSSKLWRVDKDGAQLTYVQTLPSLHPTDAAVWYSRKGVHLAVANAYTMLPNGEVNYEVDSFVMWWMGSHFDIVGFLPTKNAQAITGVQIHNMHYVLVANHMDNTGNVDVDSVVFKQSVDKDEFTEYQRIRTHGAKDWKHFSLKQGDVERHFIVVANMYTKDARGKISYRVDSVIYQFVEDTFTVFQCIPTLGALQWLPIGTKEGSMILALATAFKGLELYQYDGWMFHRTTVKASSSAGQGLVHLSTFTMGDKHYLVLANNRTSTAGGKCDASNICSLAFRHENWLGELMEHGEAWCQSQKKMVKSKQTTLISDAFKSAIKRDDETIILQGPASFEKDVYIKGTLETGSMRDLSQKLKAQGNGFYSFFQDTIEKFNRVSAHLQKLKQRVTKALKDSKSDIIEGTVGLENVLMKCRHCKVRKLQVKNLNGHDMEAISGQALFINEKESLNYLKIRDISMQSNLVVKNHVNKIPVGMLVSKSGKHEFSAPQIFTEPVTWNGPVTIGGSLDGVQFLPDHLLLTEGNQTLTGRFVVKRMGVSNLFVHTINNNDISKVYEKAVLIQGNFLISGLVTMEADLDVMTKLIVDKINQYEPNQVWNSGLKLMPDQPQVIKVVHNYENIGIEKDLEVKGHINGYSYPFHGSGLAQNVLHGPLVMDGDVHCQHLVALHSLNGIPVDQKQLQIWLVHGHKQKVRGPVVFGSIRFAEDVEVNQEINGHSISKLQMPASSGDLYVMGTAHFENQLHVDNGLNDLDIIKILKEALHIDEPIPPINKVVFEDKVKIRDFHAEAVNGEKSSRWIKIRGRGSEIISGHMKFLEEVTFSHDINVERLNGWILNETFGDVFLKDGKDVVCGDKLFSKGIQVDRITVKELLVNGKPLDEILAISSSPKRQNIFQRAIFKSGFIAKNLKMKHLNGHDPIAALKDTLFEAPPNGTAQRFLVPQTFKGKLTANTVNPHLTVNGKDMKAEFSNFLYDDEVAHFGGMVKFLEPVEIENLHFSGAIDGMNMDQLNQWLLQDKDQSVSGSVYIKGTVKAPSLLITSKNLNGLDLDRLRNEALTIDEPARIPASLQFRSVKSEGPVEVGRRVSGLKLSDEAVLKNQKTVFDSRKALKGGANIRGRLQVQQGINGFQAKELCDLKLLDSVSDQPDNIILDGDVTFHDGVTLDGVLNDYDVASLEKQIWLRDRDTVLQAPVHFHTAHFSKINLEGELDRVNVDSVRENYVDRESHKPVHLEGFYQFQDVVVKHDLAAVEIRVNGVLNGTRIDDTIKDLLLSNGDQEVHSYKGFSGCYVEGDMTVERLNSLDPRKQYFLYGKNNSVSGPTFMDTLEVLQGVTMKKGKTLSGINLKTWTEEAVRSTGDVQLHGKKHFHSLVFPKGFQVKGSLDTVRISRTEILTTTDDQVLDSDLVFDCEATSDTCVTFSTVDLLGFWNEVNITRLDDATAKRNQENVFKAQVNFLTSPTMMTAKLLGKVLDVDLDHLFTVITRPVNTSSLESTYGFLKQTLDSFDSTMEGQAISLDHYEEVQECDERHVLESVPLTFHAVDGSIIHMLAISLAEEVRPHQTIVKFLEYSHQQELYLYRGLHVLSNHATSLLSLSVDEHQFLFVANVAPGLDFLDFHYGPFNEYAPKTEKDETTVIVYEFNPAARTFSIVQKFFTFMTVHLIHIDINGIPHVFFVNYGTPETSLVDSSLYVYQGGKFVLFQNIPTKGARKASVAYLKRGEEDVPNLIICNHNSSSSSTWEAHSEVWAYNRASEYFALTQTLVTSFCLDVDTIHYAGEDYLAVVNGKGVDDMRQGSVDIYKYISKVYGGGYEKIQRLSMSSPISCDLDTLPVGGLYLIVTVDYGDETVELYKYKHASRFVMEQQISIPGAEQARGMSLTETDHYLVIKGKETFDKVQGIITNPTRILKARISGLSQH